MLCTPVHAADTTATANIICSNLDNFDKPRERARSLSVYDLAQITERDSSSDIPVIRVSPGATRIIHVTGTVRLTHTAQQSQTAARRGGQLNPGDLLELDIDSAVYFRSSGDYYQLVAADLPRRLLFKQASMSGTQTQASDVSPQRMIEISCEPVEPGKKALQ